MRSIISAVVVGSFVTVNVTAGDEISVVPEVKPLPTLRELEADRPDATESPRTVDAGYFQIESSVVGYSRDQNDGVKFEAWTWGETNLKYGLNDSMDLQLVIAPYVHETTRDCGQKEVNEGFGDLTLRLKWNMWGNDEGDTAFAVFPYVKIPTGTDVSNDKWEGGIIFPWAMNLSESVGIGIQAEFAHVWDEEDRDYDIDFLHTAVVGLDVTDQMGVYLEYLGVAGDRAYEAYASGGVTWAFSDLFQWDAGLVLGINDDAEDLNTFTGFTVKF